MLLREFFEAAGNEVAIIFGRFNPPHKGHKAAWEVASKSPIWYVGTHKSTVGLKDPLPFDVKIKCMEIIWPEVASHVVAETSWLTMASMVYEKHKASVLYCCTDEDWVTKTVIQYNGKEGPHGYYNFASIEQKPTPRLSSATDLRNAVMMGNRDAFSNAAGVSADLEINGTPFFDLVAKYLLPYADTKLGKSSKASAKLKEVNKPMSIREGDGERLSIEQLAHISDEALDNAYHYGRSSPGNTFGWQANLKSAEFAKRVIETGETDIEIIADAIHDGWNETARAFVQNPGQFDDTEKLIAAGKLDAKIAQREKLMNISYNKLPDDEQEKDRVVAKALLAVLKPVNESMMPKKNFAGSSKNKLGPAAAPAKKKVKEGIIDERKMADLYHSTDAEFLPKILAAGQLTPGRNAYISLTRDKRYNYGAVSADEAVQFVIDQAKLAYNRKIEPYDWHMDPDDNDKEAWARDPDDRRSESEERVKGPLSLKYVKEIQLPKGWANPKVVSNKYSDLGPNDKIKIINTIKKMGIKISFTTPGREMDESLTEVADQPYRYMLTKKLPNARQYVFQTDSDTKFQVFFSLLDSGTEKVADVGFADQTDKDNPTIGVTGKGDAFRVFSTVGAIVKEYVNSVKPDFLSFNGKTQDPGRIKLYDMIAKNITRYLKDYEQSSHTMPGATDEKGYMLQRITKPVDEVSKVSLSTDPDNFGAWVRDGGTPEKTVMLPASKIHVFEPDSKFDDPQHAKNLANIVKAIKGGKKLPPILVRRHGIDRFQVVDGHHRFMAYRMAGVKNIPARVVDPKNVKEV